MKIGRVHKSWMQDSDLEYDSIESVEESAEQLVVILRSIYGSLSNFIKNYLIETVVSMLKTTWHTAALFNAILMTRYNQENDAEYVHIYTKLLSFHVDWRINEISNSDREKAVNNYRPGDNWNINSKCGFGGSTAIVKSPEVISLRSRKGLKRLGKLSNVPCPDYQKVQKITLLTIEEAENYHEDGQLVPHQNPKNNPCENRLDHQDKNTIIQFTNRDNLSGTQFTLNWSRVRSNFEGSSQDLFFY